MPFDLCLATLEVLMYEPSCSSLYLMKLTMSFLSLQSLVMARLVSLHVLHVDNGLKQRVGATVTAAHAVLTAAMPS